MSEREMDPLLLAAKAIIWLLIGIMAFAGFFVVLGIPASFFLAGEFYAEMDLSEVPPQTTWLIALLLALIAGTLYMGISFFRYMLAIVNSVGEGDPFVPANGDRLTVMAWLMLAINLMVLPIGGLVYYITTLVDGAIEDQEIGMDFGGIILILILFILARVFRKGAEMRDDLEGTV